MNDIFEQIYILYMNLLQRLEIGHEMKVQDLSELWELIQLVYFVKFGHPTNDELLYIADKYENLGAFLDEIDIEI